MFLTQTINLTSQSKNLTNRENEIALLKANNAFKFTEREIIILCISDALQNNNERTCIESVKIVSTLQQFVNGP